MGRDISCRANSAGQSCEGRALLETDHILFRGDFRVKIPFAGIRAIHAADGWLRLEHDDRITELELGVQAEKWAHAILHPKTRLDKLGVKPGMRVALDGVDDPDFIDELKACGITQVDSKSIDMLFYLADDPTDLAELPAIRERIFPNGAVWIVSPRGRPEIADIVVIAAGKSAGLVDNKVCRFSDIHTALKFVVPVADRKRSS